MNMEKVLCISLFVLICYSAVHISLSNTGPDAFPVRSTIRKIEPAPDFDLDKVFTNDPLESFYDPEKRNPFIPCPNKTFLPIGGTINIANPLDTDFDFTDDPGDLFPHDNIVTDPIPKADVPDKPDDSYEPVDTHTVKHDDSIPVYLIGFAKTDRGKQRKVLLSDKKTGVLHTAIKGGSILNLTILEITPYSVKIELKDGRRIEYFKDILKENGV